MNNRQVASVLEGRIAGLRSILRAVDYQIELLEDLHEDLLLGDSNES